jgi:hypothetical protein
MAGSPHLDASVSGAVVSPLAAAVFAQIGTAVDASDFACLWD